MDVKFGKIRPNNNIFSTPSKNFSDENFFAPNLNSAENNEQQKQTFTLRLNDYDSSIMENNAYRLISDKMFKIEHKIGVLENTLYKLNSEITALQSAGASIQISELEEKRDRIERELADLNKEYSELGLSSRISGQIAAVINMKSNKKINAFSKTKTFISKKILAKISKKFGHNQAIKEALDNLYNINSGVDELIKMQIPYGETAKRYEKLTAYLNKANIIHSQISQNIDAITKNKP